MTEHEKEQLEDVRQDILDSIDNLPKNATVTKILEDDATRLNGLLENSEHE